MSRTHRLVSTGAAAFALVPLLSLIALSTSAQIAVSTARSMSLGSTVTVQGIITCGPELGGIRYLQDATAGIGVYDPAAMDAIVAGDEVIVTGELSEFNQLLEIIDVSVTLISSGNPLPTPPDLDIATGFDEIYEGELVRIQGVTFVDAGAFSASSANYDITDGATTGEVRINATSTISGTAIPSEALDIVGIMSQFDFSDPAAGYQLLPRDLSDFEVPGNPPVIATPLVQSNLSTTGFTVSFETLLDGTTILDYGTTGSLGSRTEDGAMTTAHSMDLTGLMPGTVYYVRGASVSAEGDTSFSPITPMATVSQSSGWIEVYFNNPVDHSVSTGRNAVFLNQTFDDTLIAWIGRAQTTLDIAIYNLDNNLGVVDAINDAYDRGVQVRLVANEGVNSAGYNAIDIGASNKKKSPTGMTPSGDFYGSMHNKFLVIDADDPDPNVPVVLTGSTNWTDGQLTVDPNNMIFLQDQSLARAFSLEFEEMFNGSWGPEKASNTPLKFVVGDRPVELYFSGSDDVENRIKDVIRTTDHDIHFAVFAWTRFGISYEIEDVIGAGAFAAGIIGDIDNTSDAWTVLEGAMPTTLFEDDQHAFFHHKYLLADAQCPNADPIAMTGSSNFSANGTVRSDENVLVIHDAEIANLYYQEFVARFAENGGTEFAAIDEDCEVVDPPMGFAESGERGLPVRPNPAARTASVDLGSGFPGGSIRLVDPAGRVLSTERVEAGRVAFPLQLEGLPEGVYAVHLEGKDGSSRTALLAVSGR